MSGTLHTAAVVINPDWKFKTPSVSVVRYQVYFSDWAASVTLVSGLHQTELHMKSSSSSLPLFLFSVCNYVLVVEPSQQGTLLHITLVKTGKCIKLRSVAAAAVSRYNILWLNSTLIINNLGVRLCDVSPVGAQCQCYPVTKWMLTACHPPPPVCRQSMKAN